jgi:hypothetical protein
MELTRTELTVAVEADDVRAAEAPIRRLLQARSRRVVARMNTIPVVGRRNAFRVLQILCPVVWFGGLFVTGIRIWQGDPFLEVLPGGLVTLAFGLLAAFVLMSGADLADLLMLRFTDRLWARSARKTVARTAALAPFNVTYAFDDNEWVTTVEKPAVAVSLQRDSIDEAARDGDVCLVFRSAYAQRFDAVIWAKTPEVRRAIDAFFA